MNEAKHTPRDRWAERADEYDRKNGRVHLRSIILAPPIGNGDEPEPVAYVDSDSDTRLFLAATDLLAALSAPLWLVWSNDHAAWWGPNRCLYYADVSAAGRYTLEEAMRIAGPRTGSLKTRETGKPGEMIQPAPEWIEARAAAIRKATGV